MALSETARRALQERANGLRLEMSSLKTQRDEALQEASEAQHDAALLAEVDRLELERNSLADEKNKADGSVEAAMARMNAAAEILNASTENPVDVEVEVQVPKDELPAPVEPLLGAVLDTETKEA